MKSQVEDTETARREALPGRKGERKMKGTEKQIAWAEDIRNNPINTCDANIAKFATTIPETADKFAAIKSKYIELLKKIDDSNPHAEDAKWWIESRNNLPNVIKVSEYVDTMMGNGKTLDEALNQLFGF